jgi:hypothetical protein
MSGGRSNTFHTMTVPFATTNVQLSNESERDHNNEADTKQLPVNDSSSPSGGTRSVLVVYTGIYRCSRIAGLQ